MKPLVSVIIPTYDRFAFMELALGAIDRQTFRDFEVIVVGDGAPPETAAVAAKFPFVRYVRTENQGIVCARNTGVRNASGELLAFCDDDDLYHPTKLEEQTRIFQTYPEVNYSFTNFNLVYDGLGITGTKFDDAPKSFFKYSRLDLADGWHVAREPLYPHIISFHPAFPSTVMIRRDYFEKVGRFDERYSRSPAEDLEFTLRVCLEAGAAICERPLTDVRKHGKNYSAHVLTTLMAGIEILQDSLARHAGAGAYREAVEKSIRIRAESACSQAFELRNWSAFEKMRPLCGDCSRLSKQLRAKRMIASLPGPLRNVVAKASESGLSAIKSIRGSAR